MPRLRRGMRYTVLMKDFRKGEGIEDLRESLYERSDPSAPKKKNIPPEPATRPEVAEAWQPIVKKIAPKRPYRKKVIIISSIFFFFTLLASSAFFFFASTNISAENIKVTLSGPFTIGAGDTMPLQVAVANFNEVAIEDALLIITYPQGTKKSDGSLEDLFTERIPINSLNSGQSINIPLRPIVFGEENQEFAIEALVEYRVNGSASTFEKRVAPLRYKITSTPITLTIANPRQISSGQSGEITLTLTNNAKTTINDLLVRAEYPNGFAFTSADPAPVAGNDVWLIRELAPEGTTTIRLRGIVTGQEGDELASRFTVGVARSNDFTQMATQFAEAQTSFVVESPFLAVEFAMDDEDNVRIAELGEVVSGQLKLENETNEPLYDVKVVMDVAGNAISRPAVLRTNGFFDESANTVTWDSGTVGGLRQMDPGREVTLIFAIPVRDRLVSSPTITLSTSVEARRVTSTNVSERLVSTVNGLIKVLTESVFLSEIAHVSGPQPPALGSPTEYKVTLRAQAGSNDLADGVVTTQLPAHVTFKEVVGDSSSFNFNANDRSIRWNVGTVSGGSNKTISFLVTYTPPSSHVGTRQDILYSQLFTATDVFTGKVVRKENFSLTTELPEELGFPEGNGRVVQ